MNSGFSGLGMFCFAGEEFEGMRQDRERGAQRTHGAFRAAGNIEDDGRATGSAETPAQDGEGRFAAAFRTHHLGNAPEHPIADGLGGLRGHVAQADPRSTRGYDQPERSGCSSDRVLNGDLFVWNYNGLSRFEPSSAKLGNYRRPGKILPRTVGAGVAYGNHRGGPGCYALHLLSHVSIVQTAVEAPN